MIVYPHIGVGSIRFGMSRAEVLAATGAVPKRFRATKYELSDSEQFPQFVVSYDEHERCNVVAFHRGINVPLEYDGYQLFGHSAREVREWARARDPQLNPEYGFISHVLGLSMGAEGIDVPDAELEFGEMHEPAVSFLVFKPGYWEEERERLVKAGLVPRQR